MKKYNKAKQVIKIDRYFPFSKTSSSCGALKSKLKLDKITYSCDCELSIDRDLNVSYNILSEEKKLLAY
jgi:putative transposase